MELIDVSALQGPVDWHAVYRAGIRGAWLKATEGVTYNDRNYQTERADANAAGIRVGAYHYARPDHNTPLAEAKHFCDVVGKVGRRDLKPVLDLEQKCDLHPKELETWARTWNRAVAYRLGVLPAFYSYPSYIRAISPETPIGNGLWLADYSVNDGQNHAPIVPAPWKRYIAHQYTSEGRVAGVSGHVDRSYAPRRNGVLAHPILGLL